MALTGYELIRLEGRLNANGSIAFLGSQESIATIGAISGVGAIRTISSGSSDLGSSSDNMISWNSSTASAKSQSIPPGIPLIIVVDEIGTAQTYNITITPSSGTINNAASLVLNLNNQSVTLRWNAATSNYMVI